MDKLNRPLALLILTIVCLWGADPGGVSGSALWLRADQGVSGSSVAQWNDQSGNSRDAKQNNNTYQPSYHIDNEANFNPRLHFTNHFLDVSNPSSTTDAYSELNGADLTVFVVVDLDGGSSWRSPWTTRDDYPSRGHILYYNSKYQYWTGHGTNGGWDQLNHGNTSNNYEMITTTSEDKSNNSVRKQIYLQGKYLGAHTVGFFANTQRPFRVGKGASERINGAYPWNGDITEVVVYPKKLTSTNRRRVESYLAVKYGITLDQSNGGKNYIRTASDVFWKVSNNTGYGYDIAGLAREDVSELDQRISHSINPDAIITMSTNNDFNASNLDSSRPQLSSLNRRYLMWSNDDGGSSWVTNGALPNNKILQRKWKVQKTRDNQHSVNIQIDTNDPDFNVDSFNGNLYFVKGTDLSTATPQLMTDDGNGKWHIENVDFADGDLFGFVIGEPEMHISKTSIVISDPVNSTTNPKRIPGAVIRYCLTVDNNGTDYADNVVIHDSLTGDGKDNMAYVKSGWVSGNINNICDCANITDTSGSYDANTRNVDINLTTVPHNTRKCAYIEMGID